METIVQKVEEATRENIKSPDNENQIKAFQEASKIFDELVEAGMATRRGNQLMSVDEAFSNRKQFSFNTPLLGNI